MYFSSDINALAGLIDHFIPLDDGELIYIKENDFIIKSE
jgi:glucosamine 6-phosphate synthetase-like amidotransferase/phosphosugar isomerase protein